MSALEKSALPAIPSDEMARLQGAGLSLLPLGRGDDGKSPLVTFEGKGRLPLKRVLGPMHRIGSTCYGVRLDGLAVVDCDVDDPALVAKMEARFGASPVQVKTPRGRHLYYRAGEGHFPNLRGEGLPVDIKRGPGSYVIGPGSVRPDGGQYTPVQGLLGRDGLDLINLPSAGRSPAPRIKEGSRNYSLTLHAIQMVEMVDGTDELFGNLQFIRDDECESPASVPDAELLKIAEWAWTCRLEGRVYMGRHSEFRICRHALDLLKGRPNFTDALALLVVLQDQHGHLPGKTFSLNQKAMREAGHTDLSERRFLAARKALQDVGLLEAASGYTVGKSARSYRLTRPLPAAVNVTSLRNIQGGRV